VSPEVHKAAMLAAAREDLKRCRRALEALEVTFEALLPAPVEDASPTNREGRPMGTPATPRPAGALAAALVSYLAQGGKLDPDLAQDLAHELTVMRARRALT
jgi:hypothetical protein